MPVPEPEELPEPEEPLPEPEKPPLDWEELPELVEVPEPEELPLPELVVVPVSESDPDVSPLAFSISAKHEKFTLLVCEKKTHEIARDSKLIWLLQLTRKLAASLAQMRNVCKLGEQSVAERQASVDVPWQRQAGDEGRAEDDRGQEGLSEGLGELHFDGEENMD